MNRNRNWKVEQATIIKYNYEHEESLGKLRDCFQENSVCMHTLLNKNTKREYRWWNDTMNKINIKNVYKPNDGGNYNKKIEIQTLHLNHIFQTNVFTKKIYGVQVCQNCRQAKSNGEWMKTSYQHRTRLHYYHHHHNITVWDLWHTDDGDVDEVLIFVLEMCHCKCARKKWFIPNKI